MIFVDVVVCIVNFYVDWFGFVLVGKGVCLVEMIVVFVCCVGGLFGLFGGFGMVDVLIDCMCVMLYFVVMMNGVVLYFVE